MRRGGDRAVAALFFGVVLTALVGLLDYLTPADVDFGELYMVPVILVAWMIGRRAGLAFALIAAIVEFVVDNQLRTAADASGPTISLWNGLATLLVLSALALITDVVYRERERYRALDAERTTLLRVLEQELPRPLRAADWFARTFEDAVRGTLTPALRGQFATLRHHTQEAMFLATGLLALGKLRLGGLSFDRAPVDLRALAGEAIDDASPLRARVLLSVAEEGLVVLADADRLRHAISSLIARFLELSAHEVVSVLLRGSADEAVVEISSRTKAIAPTDIEFAQLLVAGNGGRIVLVPGGSPRGALVTLYLPRAAALTPGAPAPAPHDTTSSTR